MANNIELERNLAVQDMNIQQAVKQVEGSLGGLKKVVSSVGEAISQALDGSVYFVDTAAAAQRLQKHLLVLRLAFGKLKAAIGQAFAPIGELVVPLVNQAVFALIRFVKAAGQVIAALFGGAAGSDALAASQKTLEKTTTAAGKAAKRSLASFDEIQRLSSGGGGGKTKTEAMTLPSVKDKLSPQLQRIVNKILALLRPLRELDFSPLMEALRRLGAAFSHLGGVILDGLEWAWFHILTPLAKWTIEQAAPALIEAMAAAFRMLAAAVTPVWQGLQVLYQAMEPVFGFVGDTVLQVLGQWQALFARLTAVMQEKAPQITGIFSGMGQAVNAVWPVIKSALEGLKALWSTVFGYMGSVTELTVGAVIDALSGVVEFVAGSLTGSWQRAWNGITGAVKGSVNGIIGVINVMIRAVTDGINAVIRAVNSMSFSVPEWVPVVGGKRFGFSLSTVSAPQIPYLAQGAVLPANKPFLAMVGDQRHGTNIEAPLATIQQAVGLEMESVIAAMVQIGQQILREQQLLRTTVESVELGDTVIGQAAARYDRRMAVVRGGM